MKTGEIVKVKIFHNNGNREEIILFVEDYMPYEPSAYVTDPCYVCSYGNETYMLNESGSITQIHEDAVNPINYEVTLGRYQILEVLQREDNGNGEGYWKCPNSNEHILECSCHN